MAQEHHGLILFLLLGALVLVWLCLHIHSAKFEADHETDVEIWLKEYGLYNKRKQSDNVVFTFITGCTTVVKCVKRWTIEFDPSIENPLLTDSEVFSLKHAAADMYQILLFNEWLKKTNLLDAKDIFFRAGIKKLETLHQIAQSDSASSLTELNLGHQAHFSSALSVLADDNEYNKLISTLWAEILAQEEESWAFPGVVAMCIFVAVLVGMATIFQFPLSQDGVAASKLSFLSYLTGKYLSPQNCVVVFDWEDPQVVGNTMNFVVKFFQRNGQLYPICDEDNILIEVTQGSYKVACSVEFGGTDPAEANQAKVHFTVRRAGIYHISVLVGMVHIRGSPFIKKFLPGSPDPSKICFVNHCSTAICSENISSQLFIEPRDKYGNLCEIDSVDSGTDFSVDLVEVSTQLPVPDSFHWEAFPLVSRIALVIKLEKEGCYHVTISYKDYTLQNGDFHVVVLNKKEEMLVRKNVARKNIYYEALLLTLNGERLHKPKKIYCYVSPKQLTLKEYMWKIIPFHLVTFRLCPSTKFKFESRNNHQSEPVLIIDDGCQPDVELVSHDRNVIVATFTQFLLKNIGGSETFKDKQDFFHHEVRKYHQKHFHDKILIKVSREKLLESSLKATNFSTKDWCKNFEIHFIDEEGLDWGGLKREWFELICSALFDPENQLFHTFKNDKQGLVHPTPSSKRPSHLKLKYYEFAGKIVGKCLYESALGSSYRQLVKAKFTRSFLAQLIGLRVHYKYFEQDDPELYVNKIRYIVENDVENMDLTFVEEEYALGKLINVVELVSGGSRLAVTNRNKLQYLDALAQYRLATTVKDEIQHFLKGLNELIPDNLLCIFDENELELLMCGTGNYSIADFKANHAVSGSSYEFRKVLDWFWTAVSNFTEEEMARLLQFTTGCSQLPPGGFSELSPRFHITAAPTFGNLPTAHTCFNQLCLPDYDSYEQFERALRLAINEGSEGFGMI